MTLLEQIASWPLETPDDRRDLEDLLTMAQAQGDCAVADAAKARLGTPVTRYTWRLEDISRVPAEFLALNRASMQIYLANCRANGEVPSVAGVSFERIE